MPNILFSFDDLAKSATLDKIAKTFAKYGVQTATVEAVPGTKRTSGVSYREVAISFTDSQQVSLRIKQSGDFYQVILNGKAIPITNQDDHTRAVREIVDTLDAKRAAFQKALDRRKIKPPPSMKTAAPKKIELLTQRRDDLVVTRDGLKEQLAAIQTAA